MLSDRPSPASLCAQASVVVLTLNAAPWMPGLLAAFRSLRHAPRRVLFIDSASTDATAQLAQADGHTVRAIQRAEFGHGKTRNLGVRLCADSAFMVFLTQDALPVGDDWLERILAPMADAGVALVYGRQLPRPEAGLSERFAREFNYPAGPAEQTSAADLGSRGIKAVFCSNSFAAYRSSALAAIGGFPEALPLGEDMSAALRLLQQGYRRAYEPGAVAVHSHAYSLREEFRRYFDIGALMAMDPELRRLHLATTGEGWRYARAEWNAARSPAQKLAVLARVLAKFSGFALGKRYRWLPRRLRGAFGMHRFFWVAS